MPYKNERERKQKDDCSANFHSPLEAGAGLLLSLSANGKKPPRLNTLSSSNEMNPITPMEGFGTIKGPQIAGVVSTGNHRHRLYHSPIKLNKDSVSKSGGSDPDGCPRNVSVSNESHPPRVYSWTPYHQGRGSPYFPVFAPFPSAESLAKLQNEEGRARSEGMNNDEEGNDEEMGQPVISPTSSNEKTDVEKESTPEEQHTAARQHPHWPQQPNIYPSWHTAGYPPPIMHYPPGPGYPYSWYPGAIHYPPYTQQLPTESTERETTAMSSPASSELKRDDYDWSHVKTDSHNRCVPLKSPPPNRCFGNRNPLANHTLPDFARLVNFPDFITRGRSNNSVDSPQGDGKRNCVMCGNLRACSVAGRRKHDVESRHIIPRQNKGVCTQCDVTVWLVTEEKVEVKWCKGCKNFRPWAAFGDKGSATKCVRCRKRQKEKYATQKKLDETKQAAHSLRTLKSESS